MEYKDDNGKVLYGYSQIDLNNNTKAIEHQSKIIRWGVILGWAFFVVFIFILYQIMRYHILTNIVTRCVC